MSACCFTLITGDNNIVNPAPAASCGLQSLQISQSPPLVAENLAPFHHIQTDALELNPEAISHLQPKDSTLLSTELLVDQRGRVEVEGMWERWLTRWMSSLYGSDVG